MGQHVEPHREFIQVRWRPLPSSDIIATIYQGLAIPTDLELHARQNRPVLLVPDDSPIREWFA